MGRSVAVVFALCRFGLMGIAQSSDKETPNKSPQQLGRQPPGPSLPG